MYTQKSFILKPAEADKKWYVIDASGWRWFCMFEPEINSTEWFLGRYGSYVSSGVMPIPLGIDWRLLKWQRPEVAA